MIKAYNISKRGILHINEEMPLQDYSRNSFLDVDKNWIIGVIADGVGSAPLSDQGAAIAVNTAVDYCKNHFPDKPDETNILDLIRKAFKESLKTIFKEAEELNKDVSYFDTTLDLAIYNGKELFYGHAGDSGIIVLEDSGNILSVTKQQKGSDGISLIPLRAGENYWVIKKYQNNVNSVLMATDGIYEKILHPLLNSFNNQNNIYNPLFNFFISRSPETIEVVSKLLDQNFNPRDFEKVLFFELNSLGLSNDELKEIGKSFVSNSPIKGCLMPIKLLSEIRDDKTVLVLDGGAPRKPLKTDQYKEIKWNDLIKARNNILYPDMIIENLDEEIEIPNQISLKPIKQGKINLSNLKSRNEIIKKNINVLKLIFSKSYSSEEQKCH